MDDKKQNFITEATAVFMNFGIKSVTMDELARQLGVSKKTIYTFVKDKNELVDACMKLAHSEEQCAIQSISESNENAIDELLATGELVSSRLLAIHPSIFFDLQKYHPQVLKNFNHHKNEFIKGCVIANLEKGKNQELYRENLNSEIIASMYLSFMDVLFQGNTLQIKAHSFHDIYSEYFRYHVRGIASEKGLKYLQLIIKTKNFEI